MQLREAHIPTSKAHLAKLPWCATHPPHQPCHTNHGDAQTNDWNQRVPGWDKYPHTSTGIHSQTVMASSAMRRPCRYTVTVGGIHGPTQGQAAGKASTQTGEKRHPLFMHARPPEHRHMRMVGLPSASMAIDSDEGNENTSPARRPSSYALLVRSRYPHQQQHMDKHSH